MTDLAKLIERVEAATGPDRGLDGRIAWALGWRFNGGLEPTDHDWDEWPSVAGHWHQPGDVFADINNKAEYRKGFAEGRWDDPAEFTASIDAALGLVERVLPGSDVQLFLRRGEWGARVKTNDTFTTYSSFERGPVDLPRQPTGGIAILLALLRALSARSP